jgi:hypothetical protein
MRRHLAGVLGLPIAILIAFPRCPVSERDSYHNFARTVSERGSDSHFANFVSERDPYRQFARSVSKHDSDRHFRVSRSAILVAFFSPGGLGPPDRDSERLSALPVSSVFAPFSAQEAWLTDDPNAYRNVPAKEPHFFKSPQFSTLRPVSLSRPRGRICYRLEAVPAVRTGFSVP